jgi:hypothetical protein
MNLNNPYAGVSDSLAEKWEAAISWLGTGWVGHKNYVPTDRQRAFWSVAGNIKTGASRGY